MKSCFVLVLPLASLACGGAPAPAPVVSSPPPVSPAAPSAAPVAPAPPPSPSPPATPGIVIVGEIVGPPGFDPKPTLTQIKPELGRCYDETRALVPGLHGKLTLQLRLNGAGDVVETTGLPGGTANDPGLVGCIADAMKGSSFPKPGGTATITVPLVFRR